MSFTICNGNFIVAHVREIAGDAAHLTMGNGERLTTYLPSLEPEDLEKILREVETQIIMTNATGPIPEGEMGEVSGEQSLLDLKECTGQSEIPLKDGASRVLTHAGTIQSFKQEESEMEKNEIIFGVPRTRKSRPRDPEATAIETITAAEYKRNERINKAKAAYDYKVSFAEEDFKALMRNVLTSLDEVTRTRVGQWIELRYGKV